jgi:DNA-binding NarL/FixJ family response regulator
MTTLHMRRATVLVADDHVIVREGLVRLLQDEFDVLGAVSDGQLLVESAERLRPDFIVTDLAMPGLTGIEAVRRLKAKRPDTKVIVLTMHADAELAREAIQAGASGFVLKAAAVEELVTAIGEVLHGRVYLTPALTREVLARLAHGAPPRPEVQLTPRQREVLRHIAEGRRMKEIAALLNLSTRTVETHKYEMMQALGVQSTAELVRYALEHRLVGPAQPGNG